MSETAERLRERLTTLHRELDSAEDLSDDSRHRLRQAIAEIEDILDESGGIAEADEPPDWVARLRESARQFEESHPDLVRAVDSVARALSDIGFCPRPAPRPRPPPRWTFWGAVPAFARLCCKARASRMIRSWLCCSSSSP